LARDVAACGKTLVERLTVYPSYARDAGRWADPRLAGAVRAAVDAAGRPREDGWRTGRSTDLPAWTAAAPAGSRNGDLSLTLRRAAAGRRLELQEIAGLFAARGPDLQAVCESADRLRRETVGEEVTYVVTRNINYTNVCTFR